MNNLKAKELEVYNYIKKFIKEKNYSPTFREIANHTAYNSIDSIHRVIKKLDKLGYIKIDRDNKGNMITRSIIIK